MNIEKLVEYFIRSEQSKEELAERLQLIEVAVRSIAQHWPGSHPMPAELKKLLDDWSKGVPPYDGQ